MISVEVSGSLPEVSDQALSTAMEDVAKFMQASIKRNFVEGGRPRKWSPVKRTGQPSHLYRTGRLFNSIYSAFGPNFAIAGVPGSVEYAGILNFGGVIDWPGTENGFGRGITIPPHAIPMPQREFVMFQESDIADITKIFSDRLVTFLNSHGKPI